MKRTFILLIGFSLFLTQGCATHSRQHPSEKRQRETEARAAALHWLTLVDAAKFAEAYRNAAAQVRTATTQAQFSRSMKGRRVPFGKVISRTFVGAAFTRKLTGSPDGNYESILFRTTFEHKKTAAERVILAREENAWRVVDYRVY